MRLLDDNPSFVSKPARRSRRPGAVSAGSFSATAVQAQALTDKLTRLTEELVVVVVNAPQTAGSPAASAPAASQPSLSVHAPQPRLAKLYHFLDSLPDPVHGDTADIAEPVSPSADVQAMVDQTPIRRPDPILERLQQRAVQQVLNGTTWLSSKGVGEQADPAAKNKHALASRLLAQRRVFAINRLGQYEFPRYQFDPLGQPIDAVANVLAIFDGYTPFRIASWFESTSSELGGRRPRELLSDNPQAVIEAAKAHVRGAMHG